MCILRLHSHRKWFNVSFRDEINTLQYLVAIKTWIHLAEPWASTVYLNYFVTCILQLNFCSFLMVLHNTLAYSVDKLCLTLWPFELYPSKFLCPWDLPGKNTGVDCHFLLQGVFPSQRWSMGLLCWQADSLQVKH